MYWVTAETQTGLQVKAASVQLVMWSHTWIIKIIPKALWVHVSAAELLTLDCLMTRSKRNKLFARRIFGITLALKLSQNKNLHRETNYILLHIALVPFKRYCQAFSSLSFTSVKVQLLGNSLLLSQPLLHLQETPGSFWPAAEESDAKDLCQNERLLIYSNSCWRRGLAQEQSFIKCN